MLSKRNLFRIKFAVALCAVALVSLVGFGFYGAEKKGIVETLTHDAEVLSQTIEQVFRHHMLEGGRERSEELIETLSLLTAIGRVRVYDREGTIRFSSVRGEVGRRESKGEHPCLLCHEGAAVDRHVTVSFEEGGRRFFRSVNPVRREEACNGCHAGSEATLGVLMVDLSMEEAFDVLEDFRRATILLVLSITAVFGILVFLNQVFDWFNIKD